MKDLLNPGFIRSMALLSSTSTVTSFSGTTGGTGWFWSKFSTYVARLHLRFRPLIYIDSSLIRFIGSSMWQFFL